MANNDIEWVSVEDRLPDEDGRYLVTMINDGNFHTTTRCFRGKGYGCYGDTNKALPRVSIRTWYQTNRGSCWERETRGVVAWAPMPKPYSPTMSEETCNRLLALAEEMRSHFGLSSPFPD